MLPLAREHVEVVGDFLRVLVGVDAEVAEVAPLPAERNVQVHPERDAGTPARCSAGFASCSTAASSTRRTGGYVATK